MYVLYRFRKMNSRQKNKKRRGVVTPYGFYFRIKIGREQFPKNRASYPGIYPKYTGFRMQRLPLSDLRGLDNSSILPLPRHVVIRVIIRIRIINLYHLFYTYLCIHHLSTVLTAAI